MSGLSGYDAWKTAAPEYDEQSMFVTLENGSLIFEREDGNPDDYMAPRPATVEIDSEPDDAQADDDRIVEEIKKILRDEMYVTEFNCSSSIDFPAEEGVTRAINIRALLAKALDR